MRLIPVLETARLKIRPFQPDDLDTLLALKRSVGWVDDALSPEQQRAEEEQWLRWAVLNTETLGKLYQPPYGDRAVVRKETGRLVGIVGLVPAIEPFGRFPQFGGQENCPATAEVGLFWLVGRDFQGRGYATEAAQGLIDYAFEEMRLHHLIATTDYDNHPSQAVMHRLGMTLARNPYPDPPWLQILGVLENPAA